MLIRSIANGRYKVHRTSENLKFHLWWTHCCQKWVCQSLSPFFNIRRSLHWILLIKKNSNEIFGVGMLHSCMHAFSKIQELEGLAPSSQTEGSLLRTPWVALMARKFWQKESFVNSLHWKNTFNHFWPKTLDKVKKLTNLPTALQIPQVN